MPTEYTVSAGERISGSIAYAGEHNEQTLVITLPDNMIGCDYVNVEFELPNTTVKPVIEHLVPVEGTVSVSLTQQLTAESGTIRAQAVAYAIDAETDEPHRIAKSAFIEAYIDASANGMAAEADSNPSLIERLQTKMSDIVDAITKKHAHSNKHTLDNLYCEADEMANGVITNSFASGYLHYRNTPLRRCTDGAVVNGVTTTTRDGTTYLRLAFNKEPVNISDVPNYVDIPVSTVTTVEETSEGGITTNATEIDFGASGGDGHSHENKVLLDSYTQTEVNLADAVTKKHTHENKSVLDKIKEVTPTSGGALPNGSVLAYDINNNPICELPYYTFISASGSISLKPGFTKFSAEASTSLTLSLSTSNLNFSNPEYNFTFNSGATPTTLSLPTAVVWGGGNELVVEANKRYEISIRDNIALWTSVDWEEPSE